MHPIVRECEKRKLDFLIIHTGQHYSENLSEIFLEQLRYPEVAYNLNVGSGSHGEETGKGIILIEKVLRKEEPDIVLVEGDTNSVLAGAIAAVKLRIKIGHVEAGLRSFDRRMPEEINRILADHVSDFLFAPTRVSEANLIHERLDRSRISITGNTIVDAINAYLRKNKRSKSTDNIPRIPSGDYFLVTIHRQENVDDGPRFIRILHGLEVLGRRLEVPIIYPMHPRARKRMKKLGLTTQHITVLKPLNYFKFIELQRRAKLVLTDSGGVQEESCILRVPCVTLRNSTERPETLKIGSNILAEASPEDMLAKARTMLKRKRSWQNPFGDGRTARRIVNAIRSALE